MSERLKAIPASYLILIKGNKILFHLRQNSGYMDGQYSLVAGHLEEGETPTQCMIREAKEEAGIDINPENLELVHTMYRLKTDKTGDRIDFFYVCDTWDGAITNVEPHKCKEMRFFDPDEFPSNLIPYVEEAIKNFVMGIKFSEYDKDDVAILEERNKED